MTKYNKLRFITAFLFVTSYAAVFFTVDNALYLGIPCAAYFAGITYARFWEDRDDRKNKSDSK